MYPELNKSDIAEVKFEVVPVDMLPLHPKEGYSTNPTFSEMKKMSVDQLKTLKKFTL